MLEGGADDGVGEGGGLFGAAFDGFGSAFFAGGGDGFRGGGAAFFASGFLDGDFGFAACFTFAGAFWGAFAGAFGFDAFAAGFFGGAAFFGC